jgi:hypothetical protein
MSSAAREVVDFWMAWCDWSDEGAALDKRFEGRDDDEDEVDEAYHTWIDRMPAEPATWAGGLFDYGQESVVVETVRAICRAAVAGGLT